MDFTLGIVGILLYAFVGFMMAGMMIWSNFCRAKKSSSSVGLSANVRRVFRFFLATFVLVRIAWLVLRMLDNDTLSTFILNRIAFCQFFSAFTLIVFYWAERFHKSYYDTKNFLPTLGGIFAITNAGIYLFQVIIICLFITVDSEREGNPIYEANIVADVALSTSVSLSFLIYGILLFTLTKNTDDGESDTKRKELAKIVAITIVFTLCFVLRVAMFSYRPITGDYLPMAIFTTFAYYVPEALPSLFQIYLSENTKERVERESEFIKDLYAAEEEEEDSVSSMDVANKTDSDPVTPRSPLINTTQIVYYETDSSS